MKSKILLVMLCLVLPSLNMSPSRRPVPVLLRVPAGGQSLCSSDSQQEASPCAPQSPSRRPVPVLIREFPLSIPLSMMDNSVDDMFDGCSKNMARKVKSTYFPSEMKSNPLFKEAWEKAESCATQHYQSVHSLPKDQIQALCVYTAETPNVYTPLNNALRTSRPQYTTKAFQYHALYYWLVSALETLRMNKPCRDTFRRTNLIFSGKVNQVIRFGSFTSTSKNPNLFNFGTETCFQIRTCLGAYIKKYSPFSEREVLVPPYETFKIMKIVKGSYRKLTQCKQIFVLKNAGRKTNLNCKAAKRSPFPY